MKTFNPSTVASGFYILHVNGVDPCLVKVYEYGGILHVGYGVWDGAGFVPLHGIVDDAVFVPVSIVASFNLEFEV